ncbi:hypothetical protein OF83DRAFT_775161 [Amylostereum chailletii]|nr:hypothetical protein OF83DRAFT_775161 [Amylostereum chailletii]
MTWSASWRILCACASSIRTCHLVSERSLAHREYRVPTSILPAFLAGLVSGLADFARYLRITCAQRTAIDGEKEVLSALRRDLRRDWFPVLDAGWDLPQTWKKEHNRAWMAWIELGIKAGLKEPVERERFHRNADLAKKDARAHCAWRRCVYHRTESTSTMRTCAGCGEVRYCGKECQSRDWKEGEHKKKCRRIKAA